MARKRRCPRPVNRLVMLRTKGLEGPRFQNTGSHCVKGQGNFFGIGGPGSGVSALFGTVLDASTIQATFSACVSISGVTGIEYQVDGGAWLACTGVAKVSDTVWNFDITPGTIDPGDVVRWRYLGGSDTVVDCEEAEDIGPQEIVVNNPLVLAGDFILLETGGTDIMLVEEDPDGTEGVQTEEAP